VKNKGEVLIYNLINTSPLIFTGRKLRPPGIGIEATVCRAPPPNVSWQAYTVKMAGLSSYNITTAANSAAKHCAVCCNDHKNTTNVTPNTELHMHLQC